MKDIFSDDLLDSIDSQIEVSFAVKTFGVGDLIDNRYEVERIIGRGNFGFVYCVKDNQTNQTRAVKTFYERFTSRPGAEENLRELGQHLAAQTHRHAVQIYEVGRSEKLIYFVEEFIPSLTLEKLVAAVRRHAPEKGFPEEQLVDVIEQVVALLREYPDLPHLGINPRNIFMSKTGIKVTDHGVVSALRPSMSTKDFRVMTHETYLAPELVEKGNINPTSDVFGLGRLLEYLLTLGEAGKGAVIRGPHSPALMVCARRAGDPNPANRPRSLAEFLESFHAARHEVTEGELADAVELALASKPESAPLVQEVEAKPVPSVEEVEVFDDLQEAPGAEPEAEVFAEEKPAEAGLAEEWFAEKRAAEEEPAQEMPTGDEPTEAPAPILTRPELPPRLPAKQAKYGKAWNYMAILVIAALLIAVIVSLFFRDKIFNRDKYPPDQTPAPIGQQESAPGAAEEVADQADFSDEEGMLVQPEGNLTLEEALDGLLLQADQSFKNLKMTEPPNDSAHDLYAFVLELDPNNQKAKEGIEKIKDYYLHTAKSLAEKKRFVKAQWSYEKVLSIDKENEVALAELKKIEAAATKEKEAAELAVKEAAAAETPAPAGSVPAGTVEVASLSAPMPETEKPTKSDIAAPDLGGKDAADGKAAAPATGGDSAGPRAAANIPEPENKPAAAETPPPGKAGSEVKTALTKGDIQSTMGKYMGRIRLCFAQSPDSEGVVKIRFVIDPTGIVSDVRVAKTTLNNAAVEDCLRRRVSLMRFPKFQGAPKTIVFPFTYKK